MMYVYGKIVTKMKKIYLAAVISVITFVLSSIGYVSLDYFEDQEPKSKVFADLTCEEIRKLNIAGLKIPENDTTFSQDRIFECIKEIADELDDADEDKVKKHCETSNGVYHKDKCYDTFRNWDVKEEISPGIMDLNCSDAHKLEYQQSFNSEERRIIKEKRHNCVEEMKNSAEYKAIANDFKNCDYFVNKYENTAWQFIDDYMIRHWVYDEIGDCKNK